jgi:hypothetical protein
MTHFRPRYWTGVGAAALLTAASLTACSGEGGEGGREGGATPAAAPAGEGGEGGAERGAGAAATGEAGAEAAYAGVPEESRRALRLAHLKGFFLAAQAAHPAQGAEAAAALAGQGMLEVYDPAADHFKAAGLDAAPLRKAAGTGSTADLAAALRALETAQQQAGGDPAAVTRGMTSIAAGLYRGVVAEGAVDPVEYQHAYGAALSARDVAARAPKLASARAELDRLVGLWPSPVAPDEAAKATPPGQVQAQASRVELALSGG